MCCADCPLSVPDAAAVKQRLAALSRLAEIGMEIAEAAGRRACADDAPAGGSDPTLAFTRAARAVRLTFALQARLEADLADQAQARAKARAAEAARRRDRIHTQVEAVIEADHTDPDEAERLSAQVWERLTEEDGAEVLDLPLHEAVARICHDLGLEPRAYAPFFATPAPGPPTPSSVSASCRESRAPPQGPSPSWRPLEAEPEVLDAGPRMTRRESPATKAAPPWATNGG